MTYDINWNLQSGYFTSTTTATSSVIMLSTALSTLEEKKFSENNIENISYSLNALVFIGICSLVVSIFVLIFGVFYFKKKRKRKNRKSQDLIDNSSNRLQSIKIIRSKKTDNSHIPKQWPLPPVCSISCLENRLELSFIQTN